MPNLKGKETAKCDKIKLLMKIQSYVINIHQIITIILNIVLITNPFLILSLIFFFVVDYFGYNKAIVVVVVKLYL